jgi:NADH-quinone oxidoreductase subunit L
MREQNAVVAEIGHDFTGPVAFAARALISLPFWLAAAGVWSAWWFVLKSPESADALQRRLAWLNKLLVNKYYFDWFNENVLARLSRALGSALWRGGDRALIDGVLVDGSAHSVGRLAGVVRQVQSGYLYSYAFWMIVGLVALIGWFLFKV